MRDLANKPLAPGAAAVRSRHVGLGPSFIDEDQTGRIELALMGLPA